MGLAASERRDALHEIEDTLCRAADYAEQVVDQPTFQRKAA